MSKSPPKSSNNVFVPICDGLLNATTHPTLSLKGLAIDVNCCVNTKTDKPLCLPENANSINLFERFFRSLDTAQSSRMINVFVPENNTALRPV